MINVFIYVLRESPLHLQELLLIQEPPNIGRSLIKMDYNTEYQEILMKMAINPKRQPLKIIRKTGNKLYGIKMAT
jgi:hypothetical protein